MSRAHFPHHSAHGHYTPSNETQVHPDFTAFASMKEAENELVGVSVFIIHAESLRIRS